jgi:hypothetical protein
MFLAEIKKRSVAIIFTPLKESATTTHSHVSFANTPWAS